MKLLAGYVLPGILPRTVIRNGFLSFTQKKVNYVSNRFLLDRGYRHRGDCAWCLCLSKTGVNTPGLPLGAVPPRMAVFWTNVNQ